MKTANRFGFFAASLTLGLLSGLPANAQVPQLPTAAVTVPPATAPVAVAEPTATTTTVTAPVAATALTVTTTTAAAPTPMPVPPAPMEPQIAPTAGGSVTAVTPTTATIVTTATAPVGIPAGATQLPGSMGVTGSADSMPPLANMPTGTPVVVGQVVQSLQQARSNVSVEDLSRAQDALARLDLLLQIEKKMGEIKQVQDERANGGAGGSAGGMGGGTMSAFGAVNGSNPGSMGGIISQVPASALVLPATGGTGATASGTAMPTTIKAAPASTADYAVEQVSGTNGDYSAILRSEDGDVKTVKVGDRVEGRTVESIGLDGVHLADGGTGKHKRGGKTLELKTDGIITTPSTPLIR